VSAEHVAEALERLYREMELRRKLSVAAFDAARRPAYSWDRIAQRFDALLRDVA
jgi:glycosyltransferase involved in cell wall biosynthesis